jgi:uncharacterized protein YecA (UPF0149 family)
VYLAGSCFEIIHQASEDINQHTFQHPNTIKNPLTDDTRNPAQYTQQNVYQEVCATSSVEKYGKRRKEDGKEVEADVGLFGDEVSYEFFPYQSY